MVVYSVDGPCGRVLCAGAERQQVDRSSHLIDTFLRRDNHRMKYALWAIAVIIAVLLGAMISFYVSIGYFPNSFTEFFEFFF